MGLSAGLMLAWLPGCESTDESSVEKARLHASALVDFAGKDVAEVRRGLPAGAAEMAKAWKEVGDLAADPQAARDAIERSRDRVQDLRVAKSTFFALTTADGTVVRNDREQDLMAGTSLFEALPSLKGALEGGYVEALGDLPEARGVRGKPDGQWMAAQGIRVEGEVRGLYVTGWAWSSYCYRLEFALRGRIEGELRDSRQNVPLVYAFALVGDSVFSAPEAPEVNAEAIASVDPWEKLGADGRFGTLLDVTGRRFALAVQRAPELGERVALGVLRSET